MDNKTRNAGNSGASCSCLAHDLPTHRHSPNTRTTPCWVVLSFFQTCFLHEAERMAIRGGQAYISSACPTSHSFDSENCKEGSDFLGWSLMPCSRRSRACCGWQPPLKPYCWNGIRRSSSKEERGCSQLERSPGQAKLQMGMSIAARFPQPGGKSLGSGARTPEFEPSYITYKLYDLGLSFFVYKMGIINDIYLI